MQHLIALLYTQRIQRLTCIVIYEYTVHTTSNLYCYMQSEHTTPNLNFMYTYTQSCAYNI